MICPNCKSEDLKVLEKRDIENEPAIRRRRECLACGFRFTTYERPESPALVVIKKDGTKESYSREKLAKGIEKALEKRPFSEPQVALYIEEVEKEIYALGGNEIESKKIGDLVLAKLRSIDEVAYLRFVSVYKSFDNVNLFKKEAEELQKTR